MAVRLRLETVNMYNIIDGNLISKSLFATLKEKCNVILKSGKKITLVDILVGYDDASKIYVANKKKKFEEIGIEFKECILRQDISEEELIKKIDELNNDTSVNAIFIELPLPKSIDESCIIDKIKPEKDVDGFSVKNLGALLQGKKCFIPCTAEGIVELLKASNIQIESKHCVVIGRSNIVGKPVALLLLQNNATVTICHSKTENIKEICKTADILIVATGKAKSIDDSYVKEGAVVVDVGIHREIVGGVKKVCGDVDFEKVAEHTSYITPVPGGVGPMTVNMLIKHCIETVDNG